jgi:soluble lytic murein transglycosylase
MTQLLQQQGELALVPRRGGVLRWLWPCLAGLCLLWASRAMADAEAADEVAPIEQERMQFQVALEALETGADDVYQSLLELSKGYILYPYLVYYDLNNRLDSASDDEIIAFIEKYKDTPLSNRLRWHWLYDLGEAQNWSKFQSVYNGERSTKLRCYNLTARLSLDPSPQTKKKVLAQAEKLWMVGYDRPEACDVVFHKLEASPRITSAKLWQRIELAMKRGNVTLAKRLAQRFNRRDRRTVALWANVYGNPEKGLKLRQLKRNTAIHRKIVMQAIKRIASRDAARAKQIWDKLVHKYSFTAEQRGLLSRTIALRGAYQREPQALAWLKQVDSDYSNRSVRFWRIRTALQTQQWPEVIAAINALKPREADKDKWRYWLARAKDEEGETAEALTIYSELAEATNYYAFLAADRVNKKYAFNSQPIERDQQQIEQLQQLPSIQRARELYMLGQVTDARREWNTVIRHFNENKMLQAAVLAHQWQWYDNAILTVARTSQRRDLDLRFPTPFRDEVLLNAQTYDLDPWLIYGVARRESAFNIEARSTAGALGLMQLLPTTARYQSKLLGVDRPSRTELLTSEKNLFLGSAYLNTMLQRFNGNQVLATAAYNAGPRRINSYIPKSTQVPADVWIDTLPIKETRAYVRAVLAYSIIFNWKLEQKITPLKQRMAAIGGNDNNLSSL